MREFYTYLHTKPNGDIFYVGKGYGNRAKEFKARNDWHKKVVAKYGRENIGVYVFPCNSEEQAFADEIQQIAQLRKEGYELSNICDGGQGACGLKHTEEFKKARAEKLLGNTRTLGYKHSEENRKKISEAGRNRIFSLETRKKISDARKGMKFSEETCKRISEGKMGGIPWNKGLKKAK